MHYNMETVKGLPKNVATMLEGNYLPEQKFPLCRTKGSGPNHKETFTLILIANDSGELLQRIKVPPQWRKKSHPNPDFPPVIPSVKNVVPGKGLSLSSPLRAPPPLQAFNSDKQSRTLRYLPSKKPLQLLVGLRASQTATGGSVRPGVSQPSFDVVYLVFEVKEPSTWLGRKKKWRQRKKTNGTTPPLSSLTLESTSTLW